MVSAYSHVFILLSVVTISYLNTGGPEGAGPPCSAAVPLDAEKHGTEGPLCYLFIPSVGLKIYWFSRLYII